MVNSYLPGCLRPEIFAGCIVKKGFFCPSGNPGSFAYNAVSTK
jgi:hypothetical protein